MKRRLPHIFGFLIVLALFIPMSQQFFGYMYVRELSGETHIDSAKRELSWWNRSIQSYLETYSTDSLSLQPACVRLKNQFEYTFFDKLNAHDIYEYNGIFYRYTYYTSNEVNQFVGMEKIRRQVAALKQFQEKLNPDSIPIYIIIAPTKLHTYAEQLPAFNRANSEKTNYHQYKRLLDEAGIRVIDTDGWFRRDKAKLPAPALSTGGVHWTLYGGALAMDSLVKRVRYDKHIDFQTVEMEISKGYKLYPEDMDAVNLCNLMYPPVDKRLRLIHFPPPAVSKRRIRPVVISDSFFHVIAWTPLHDQIFEPETSFYYYFRTRFPHNGKSTASVNMMQVTEDIRQADCIIFITDIQNLENFGFGFIEKYIPFFMNQA